MKIRPVLGRAIVLPLFLILLSSRFGFAQNDARDYVVGLWATTTTTPPAITLHWKPAATAIKVSFYRRDLGTAGAWGKSHALKITDSAYTDTTVEIGKSYEYYVLQNSKSGTTTWDAKGYIAAGIKALPEPNGVLVLVVDSTIAAPLATELARLQSDIEADGYRVIRHDVSRTASVEDVKTAIQTDWYEDPLHVQTLLLFGHVPVPYSGDIVPDGHVPGAGNHQGAWACDSYYGNFDGGWTDDRVNDTTAYRLENKNVPGDGKFDQDAIESNMNLEVGRVDMANMPAFSKSEVELLRQYLNKDHAFRTGQLNVRKKALVDINFGVFAWYDVPGEDAWRIFPTLVGPENIVNFHDISTEATWNGHLDTASYLWAYGCGGGWYTGSSGVGSTSDFAAKEAKGVFYLVFGSFFGDWDSQDNYTRAPLASGNGLASCWVSRPFWFFHPMGLGKSLGYCTRITMDNGVEYRDYVQGISEGGVHLGLMGDPTLRQEYPLASLATVNAQVMGGRVELTWPTIGGVSGYDVYRASSATSAYERLTTEPVPNNGFTDSSPIGDDTNYYLVRPAALVTGPSGSYYAEGPGVAQHVYVQSSGVGRVAAGSQTLHVSQTEKLVTIDVRLSAESPVDLMIVDPLGREILALEHGRMLSGAKTYTLEPRELSSGLYFAKLHTASGEYSAKIMIAK